MTSYPAPSSGFNLGGFNPSYYTQPTDAITYADADLRYVKLSGGTMTGGLVSTSLSAPSLSLSGSNPSINLTNPLTVNNSILVSGGVQPSTGNYLGMRFIGATSTGVIRAYNYVMGNYNHIDFNDQAFYIQATGNIGMGTNLPAYKLDITGTTRLSGSLLIGSGNTDSSRLISALKGTMVANDKVHITLGRDNSSKNQAEINFTYAGAASDSNRLVLGMHGSETLAITAAKTVSIGDAIGAMKFNVLDSINNPSIRLGKSETSNNSMSIRFIHVGSGDNRNGFAFDPYGTSNCFTITSAGASCGDVYQSKGRFEIWNQVNLTYSGTMQFYNIATNAASSTTSSPVGCGLYCNGNAFINNWIMCLSDKRVKTDIKDIDVSDDMFMKFRPKRYIKNEHPKHEIGLIAQDVYHMGLLDILDLTPNENMKKSCEDDPEDGFEWAMQYDKVGVLCIPVIQRLINRVDILEEEKWNLTKQVQTLEEDIEECKVLSERLDVLEQTLKNAKTLKEIRGALE